MSATTKPSKGTLTPSTVPEGYLVTEPSAARIADIAAGQPYSAVTASMDILDNSIENGARGVAVAFELTKKKINRIVFADNGTGIASEIIDEVLRAGSRTNHLYRPTSLSRFGIGLKGAGFSLAERITVLTRNDAGDFFRRAIDLRRIEETDQWQQEIWDANAEERAYFDEQLANLPGDEKSKVGRTGTIVLLDRVKLQTRDLAKLKNNLVRAAGETYGKFLAGSQESQYRRLAIRIDDIGVEPVDPLHRENKNTLHIIKRERVAFDDGTTAFFTAVALPHPNTQPAELVKKYRYHQKTQGVYVYRNGRLIRSAETFDIFGRDFHLNAFRAELEYSSDADSHIPVDVAKSTIRLDEEAAQKLGPLVKSAQQTANLLWREKDILSPDDIKDLFNESNRLIGSRANLLLEAVNKRRGQLDVPKRKLLPVPKPRAAPAGTAKRPEPRASSAVIPEAQPDAPPSDDSSFQSGDNAYLSAVDYLPGGVLYRPRLDGEFGGLIVEVNLSHPFAKAVFEVSSEGKGTLPRRATTAVQQLLYVLGYCEFTMVGEDDSGDDARMFEQYRRYVSMNSEALLD